MVVAGAAWADVTVRADLGVAQPISSPTRDYFSTGFDVSGALSVDLAAFLELSARVAYVFVSQAPGSVFGGPASLIAVGPALRIHPPREGVRWGWWGEVSPQYVRTGPLDRFGLTVGGGVQFELHDRFWLGPWVGIHQVFRLVDAEGYPTRDATVFLAGVAIELAVYAPRRTVKEEVRVAVDRDPDHDRVLAPDDRCPSTPEDRDGFEDDDGCPDLDDDGDEVLDADDACPRQAGPAATHGCPDRDLDGIADADDRCPDVRGVVAEAGCPAYRELKVGTTRIELAQRVGFSAGSSTIPSRAAPMLDELALALSDRPMLCVRIEAHADGFGGNPALARSRADAVRLHLLAKGISPSRLTASGDSGPGDVSLTLQPCEVHTP